MSRNYDLNDENAREQFAKTACAFVASLQPIEQERYYRIIAKKTGYPLEALEAQGQRSGGIVTDLNKSSIRGGFRRRAEDGEDPRDVTERTLLLACLKDREALRLCEQANAHERIRNPIYLALYQTIREQGDRFSLPNYVGELSEKEAEAVSAILREEDAEQNAARAAADCLKRLEQENEADEIARLQAELKRPNLTAEERNAVLKEITNRIRANK